MALRRFSRIFVALTTLIPSVVTAAPIDGKVRLSLETSVLSHEGFTVKAGAAKMSRSETGFGLGGGGLGLGAGVGLGENLLLGGRVLYQSNSQSGDDAAASVTTRSVAISVTPEFVFSGDDLRPFLGATLGHRAVSSESTGVVASTSLTFAGPVAGLHCFATDSVSIDPSLAVTYEAGGVSAAGMDLDRSGYALMLGVSLSGWLGGTGTRVAPKTAEPTPAPSGNPETGSAETDAVKMPRTSTIASSDSDAPVSSTQEQPAPQRVTPKADLHDLRVTLPLGGPSRLLLTVDPDRGPNVETVLIASDTEALQSCDSLTARGPAHPVALGPFTKKRIQAGTASLIVLRTAAPLSTIRALGKAQEPVVLEGCGQSIELSEATQDVLRRFAVAAKQALRTRAAEGVQSAGLPTGGATLSVAGGAFRTSSAR